MLLPASHFFVVIFYFFDLRLQGRARVGRYVGRGVRETGCRGCRAEQHSQDFNDSACGIGIPGMLLITTARFDKILFCSVFRSSALYTRSLGSALQLVSLLRPLQDADINRSRDTDAHVWLLGRKCEQNKA